MVQTVNNVEFNYVYILSILKNEWSHIRYNYLKKQNFNKSYMFSVNLDPWRKTSSYTQAKITASDKSSDKLQNALVTGVC